MLVVVVGIVSDTFSYFQTYYVLISPLIEKSVIDGIAKPYFYCATISTVFFLVDLYLYWKRNYKIVIALSVLIIIFQQLFVYLYFR